MTSVSHTLFSKKTLVALAVGMSCVGTVYGQSTDIEKSKTISLIKKPISLVKKKTANKVQPAVSQQVLYSDIARLLNKLPGVFAINRLPNDNSPLVSHHSDPLTHNVALISDNLNWNPLPFYLGKIAQLTPLFFSNTHTLNTVSSSAFPSSSATSITTQRPTIEQQAKLDLTLGSNQQRGIRFDHGSQKADFGHRFYVNSHQADSHREFSNGDQGRFESNEVMVKLRETSRASDGKNKQNTQIMLHYKDYKNDESRVGITGVERDKKSEHRFEATRGDYISGDDLLFGIRHETTLFAGERVTTDVFYRRGNFTNYQVDNVNGLARGLTAGALSVFERMTSGELIIDKYMVDSDFSSAGVKFDIEQHFGAHRLNLGVDYQQEEIEQLTFHNNYTFNTQQVLSRSKSNVDQKQLDLKATTSALYLSDFWQYGDLTVDAGVRLVKFDDRRENINTKAVGRDDDRHTLFNLNLAYQLTPNLNVHLGARKGVTGDISIYSPKLAKVNNQVTAGLSYKTEYSYLALTGYYREFDNVLQRCELTLACAALSDNRTDIEITAVELKGGYVTTFDSFTMPMSFAYSHRSAEYTADAQHVTLNLTKGDELTYLPEQQLALTIGAQFDKFYLGSQVQYRGKLRLLPGSNRLTNQNSLDDVTLVDLTASYQLTEQQRLSLAVENLLDEEYAEHAMYSGYMMARKRFISLNYQFRF